MVTPTTAAAGEDGPSPDPTLDGILERDATAGCVPAAAPRENLKVTTPVDLAVAELLLGERDALGDPA